MKKLFAILFSVLLFWCFTVTAFASEPAESNIPGAWVVGDTTYLGRLMISSGSTEIKALWNTMAENWDSLYFSYTLPKKSGGAIDTSGTMYLYIFMVADGATLSIDPIKNVDTLYFTYSKPFQRLAFSAPVSVLSLPVSERTFTLYANACVPHSNATYGWTWNLDAKIFGGQALSSDNRILGQLVDSRAINRHNTSKFMFLTDVNPDPDPPSSSSSSEPEPLPPVDPPSRPEPSQPPLDYPTFPKVEGVYIPYDTTVWNKFAFDVRGSIGSSTNIAFILFGILAAIFVLLRVIRSFAGTDSAERNREDDYD